MAFRNKCIMGCPKCKGDSCTKRQTEVITHVVVETGSQDIVCDEISGMLHPSKDYRPGADELLKFNVIKLEDWVPADGRFCKIGGFGFELAKEEE